MSKQQYKSPTIDKAKGVPIIKPAYFDQKFPDSNHNNELIQELSLVGHREGGYFNETDRSPFYLQNPFYNEGKPDSAVIESNISKSEDSHKTRNYSTLIYYLLTPKIPYGRFHKNLNRIIHILQKGRGQYVLIYPSGEIKSFIVGFNHAKGEISQWVVPGGVWKASFLLPLDEEEGETKDDHLLISEVVVPGFEYSDHQFLEQEKLISLVGEDNAKELTFLQSATN